MNRKRSYRSTFKDFPRLRNVMSRTEPVTTTRTCAICFTAASQQKLRYDCAACQNTICNECLRRYAQCAVLDREMLPLRCPGEKCDSPFPHRHLINVLSAKQYGVITKPPTTRSQQGYIPISPEDLHNFQELMKLATKNGWQHCPRCNALVAKDGGCSIIYCRCGHCFNWCSTKSNLSGENFTFGTAASASQIHPWYDPSRSHFSSQSFPTAPRTNPLPSRNRIPLVPRSLHNYQNHARNTAHSSQLPMGHDAAQQHPNFHPRYPKPKDKGKESNTAPPCASFSKQLVLKSSLGEFANHFAPGRASPSHHATHVERKKPREHSSSKRDSGTATSKLSSQSPKNASHTMTTRSKAKSAMRILRRSEVRKASKSSVDKPNS